MNTPIPLPKLKCPSCGQRVALWTSGHLMIVGGRRDTKVRRGTRQEALQRRRYEFWEVEPGERGAPWRFRKNGTGGWQEMPEANVARTMIDINFACCGLHFDPFVAVVDARRAESRNQEVFTLRRPGGA